MRFLKLFIVLMSTSVIFSACDDAKTTHNSKGEITSFPTDSLKASLESYYQGELSTIFQSEDTGMIAVALYLEKNDTVLIDEPFYYGSKTAPTGTTIFQMGSVTKTFTAAMVAQEVVKGNMKLSDTLQNLLPNKKGFKAPNLPTEFNGEPIAITVEDVLTMHAGYAQSLPLYMKNQIKLPYHTAFKIIDTTSLLFKPGTNCNVYSNVGFALAGLALSYQAYSSDTLYYQKYKNVVEDSLISKVGMKDTRIFLTPKQDNRRAIPYGRNGKVNYNNASWPFNNAAGALYSTLDDMRVYGKTMIGKGSIDRQVLDTLLKPRNNVWPATDSCHAPGDKSTARQCIGWVKGPVVKQKDGTPIMTYNKNGGVSGFSTYIAHNKVKINQDVYKAYVVIWVNYHNNAKIGNQLKINQLGNEALQEVFNLIP